MPRRPRTSWRNEKTPLGSNSTRSVSNHHLGFAFTSSAKSSVDEGRPIAFKTRFFNFPHRGEANKHPWDQIPGGRFYTTILGGLFQTVQKAELTKVAQLRSKRVFSHFPIVAKRIKTIGIKFYEVGFIPPNGWAFRNSAKSRVDESRPIAFKTRFFAFPHRSEAHKNNWDQILRGRFHTTKWVGFS